MDPRGRPATNERSVMGERIAQARSQAGLSQMELAHKLGVKQQTIVKWERTAANIRSDSLIKLAEALNVSADELLGIRELTPLAEPPAGKCRVLFNEVAGLPRRERERIISVVEDMLARNRQAS